MTTRDITNDSVNPDVTSLANLDRFPLTQASSGLLKEVAWSVILAAVSPPPGFLYGLTLANNGSDPTNDIDIAVGQCIDSTNAIKMVLAGALTKRLDASWAVGTNQGGLDTGAIADVTYHVFLIMRSDTGVVDVLFSASASAPTMPTNYDYKRRIGSIVRGAGAILKFKQDGDKFMWDLTYQDVNVTNPGINAVTRQLTVPSGIRVEAILSVQGGSTSLAADNPIGIYISDLSLFDQIATGTGAFNVSVYSSAAAQLVNGAGNVFVFTNTSAQVRSRLQVSTASTVLRITTLGWIDTRGRLG